MIAGDGPAPSLVLSLVEGLPDDSMTVALMSGGREFLGWTEDRAILASVFDALNLNTLATGQWKKGKQPKFEPWPRPSAKAKKNTKDLTPTRVDLKQIHAHFAAGR